MIDETIRLSVNDGIHVARVLTDDEEDRRVHTYVANRNDTLMVLPIPSAAGVLMYFPTDARLAVYVTRDDSQYRGESRVVRVFRRRSVPVMEVTVPGSYERVQRREYVRWECSLNVRWWAIDGAIDEGQGITVNLSCGGMLGGSRTPLRLGGRYRFEVRLPGAPLSMNGIVVRIDSDGGGSGSLWAVDFTRIGVADQDRIVSYIFGEQLRLRRLGLL